MVSDYAFPCLALYGISKYIGVGWFELSFAYAF